MNCEFVSLLQDALTNIESQRQVNSPGAFEVANHLHIKLNKPLNLHLTDDLSIMNTTYMWFLFLCGWQCVQATRLEQPLFNTIYFYR